MTDEYRWELIDTLKSAQLADLLMSAPDINQRLFIDAAKLLEEQANEIEQLAARVEQIESSPS